ncbi:unnamed protein product, partial [Closterium sp. Naga37s-1]
MPLPQPAFRALVDNRYAPPSAGIQSISRQQICPSLSLHGVLPYKAASTVFEASQKSALPPWYCMTREGSQTLSPPSPSVPSPSSPPTLMLPYTLSHPPGPPGYYLREAPWKGATPRGRHSPSLLSHFPYPLLRLTPPVHLSQSTGVLPAGGTLEGRHTPWASLPISPIPFPPSPSPLDPPRASIPSAGSAGVVPAGGTLEGRHTPPPGYYLREAPWKGASTWHIHFPGGGWCGNKRQCRIRAGMQLGSTSMWPTTNNGTWAQGQFLGILSSSVALNPFFAGWHLAMAVYCDGGGYAGAAGRVAVGEGRYVYMDGSRIVSAIMDDLLANRAIARATTVLVSGTSAGGLAVMRLCDSLAALLPRATVKCLLDGSFFPGTVPFSFFPDAPDRTGRMHFQSLAQQIAALHQFSPQSRCDQVTPASERWRCFFPQYALPFASSPFFILNTVFDDASLLIDLNGTQNGMAGAPRILISGCSAGGFPVTRICDSVAAAHPMANVKCLIDGALFLANAAKVRNHGSEMAAAAAAATAAAVCLAVALLAQVSAATASASASSTGPIPSGVPNTNLYLLPNNDLGAKCLDGSPPGYYFRPGSGSGAKSWHIHLPIGGWCATMEDCADRAKTPLGSTRMQADKNWRWSKFLSKGMMSPLAKTNPLFFNWNYVMPVYCDGGGFQGKAGLRSVQGGPSLYLDGRKVLRAILRDVLATRGMSSASEVLISGASAGAQAVTTFCDFIAAQLPGASTKCLMDSGVFVDARDRKGGRRFRSVAQKLVAIHQFQGSDRCSA